MRRCLASSLLVAALAQTALAQSRPMVPAAKTELDRGLARFAAHDYVGAITAFDAGYAIDPHPDFMYAKAQAQRLGGDCRGAITSYNAFLATNPPAREGDVAKSNVAKCEALLAASRPAEPEPPVVVPAKPTTTPPPDVQPRKELPPPPVDEGTPWWHDKLGLTLAAGSVVTLGVSVGFTLAARSANDDMANAGTLADWLDARDVWQNDRLVAGITAGAGAVLAGLAIVRFATADHGRPRDGVSARIGRTRGGTVLVLEGAW